MKMRKSNAASRAILRSCTGLIFGLLPNNFSAQAATARRLPRAERTDIQQRENADSKTIEGDWEATLDAGAAKLRLILHVVGKDGALKATLDSPDQGATGLTIDTISVNEGVVRFEMNPDMPPEVTRMWAEKHKEWIAKVPGGRLVVAEKSHYFIQVDEPQLVIEAIRQQVRPKPVAPYRVEEVGTTRCQPYFFSGNIVTSTKLFVSRYVFAAC